MLALLRKRLDSWPLVGVAGIAYVLSQLYSSALAAPLGPGVLAVQLTLSASQVRELLDLWEGAGLLGAYAAHLHADLLQPLWYAPLLGALLAKAFNAYRMPARWNAVLLMPFAAGAFDLLENLVHLSFLADRERIGMATVLFGNGAAILKWGLAIATVSSIAILALKARMRRDAEA